MTKKLKVVLTFFCVLFIVNTGYSQTVGKIFSKSEANVLFGNIIESAQMNISQFTSVIQQTNNFVMVKVQDGELIILGNGRALLYPSGKSIGPNEVFYLYSKSKIIELLGMSSENVISVERRSNTTTLTYGSFTLEEGWPCPPWCQ
ncbi:MAG: hypothetical protein HY963_01530 [Ignavibacteriales bacterium]|nr:hypothetical protein [Ignavibacteriales bacterium]